MSNQPISGLTATTAPVVGTDLLVMVDVSDTTQAPAGTTKKTTVSELTVAAIGLGLLSHPVGQVVYGAGSPLPDASNALLFWDNTNHRLGVGTGTPSAPLHVSTLAGAFPDAIIEGDQTHVLVRGNTTNAFLVLDAFSSGSELQYSVQGDVHFRLYEHSANNWQYLRGQGTGAGAAQDLQGWNRVTGNVAVFTRLAVHPGSTGVVGAVLTTQPDGSINQQEWQNAAGVAQLAVASNGRDLVLDTVLGSQIGTASTQKVAFYGATPKAQAAAIAAPLGGVVIDIQARAQLVLLLNALSTTLGIGIHAA